MLLGILATVTILTAFFCFYFCLFGIAFIFSSIACLFCVVFVKFEGLECVTGLTDKQDDSHN